MIRPDLCVSAIVVTAHGECLPINRALLNVKCQKRRVKNSRGAMPMSAPQKTLVSVWVETHSMEKSPVFAMEF